MGEIYHLYHILYLVFLTVKPILLIASECIKRSVSSWFFRTIHNDGCESSISTPLSHLLVFHTIVSFGKCSTSVASWFWEEISFAQLIHIALFAPTPAKSCGCVASSGIDKQNSHHFGGRFCLLSSLNFSLPSGSQLEAKISSDLILQFSRFPLRTSSKYGIESDAPQRVIEMPHAFKAICSDSTALKPV